MGKSNLKVLHLASSNRWTGAAAPAFSETEALRTAGVEAHFAFTGGYRLEERLAGFDFAHPVIRKPQDPVSFFRTVSAIEELIRHYGIDIIHAHLSYDHWLAVAAARRLPVHLVRSFHSRRALRNDPLNRFVTARTARFCTVNNSFDGSRLLGSSSLAFTPPPVDRDFFSPGIDARSEYGLSTDTPVIGVIGKMSPGRGFESAFRTFALIYQQERRARFLVIGHGESRRGLERLSQKLEIEPAIIWAGYHENDLPEHFRIMNLMLFCATGSDEGHRAVTEAMACGTPVVTLPIPGVQPLLEGMNRQMISLSSTPESLASLALERLNEATSLRETARVATEQFGYASTAGRLREVYSGL